MTQQAKISCSNCGKSLDPSWAHITGRPPCPSCGKKGVAIAVNVAGEINIAGSFTVGMEPARTRRDWQQRWNELEQESDQLNVPHTEIMSGDAINSGMSPN